VVGLPVPVAVGTLREVGVNARVTEDVMRELKDFQRTTVDHVFERLYAPGASGRFLVADEVGLGKTLVARGVIAKAIDHLREKKVPRIDVVYICSNGEIARQNINRLKVGDEEHIPLVSRLTLLPRELPRLKATKSGVNFISFTPGTSFDLRSGLGQAEERVLIYWLLRETWQLGTGRAAINVFQGHSSAERFRQKIEDFDSESLHDESRVDFVKALDLHMSCDRAAGEIDLRTRFDALCAAYSRSDRSISAETSRDRDGFIGELRAILAKSCVKALEPDLIILDEFQRFGHLLDGEDDASRLARELFTYPEVRVLLLSATPYKMYTTADDVADEDHYGDFVRTIRFLERSNGVDSSLEATVAAYRETLLGVAEAASAGPSPELAAVRDRLEERLRRVMVRTERLASTTDRNGMLVEVQPPPMRIEAKDLLDFRAIQRVARDVEGEDTLELWKSTPFVLNFADDGYKLGRKIGETLGTAEGRARMARTLGAAPGAVLSSDDTERYAAIDPGNARARAFIADVVDHGAWRLLWVPPALPYYRLEGDFAAPELVTFTKRLVFSSWRMVPRALAALVSYEVERRMLEGSTEARNTPESRKTRGNLLRFTASRGRLTGMPVLALLYPSLYLARACDPATLLRERARERSEKDSPSSTETISLEDVLALARERISVGLSRLGTPPEEGAVDERWYWAAPLLLDRALDAAATRAWFAQDDLADVWSGGDEKEADVAENGADNMGGKNGSGGESEAAGLSLREDAHHWRTHVEQACSIAASGTGTSLVATNIPLGRMPEDLVEVLAELAVAGPAVAMFRALDRVVGGEGGLKSEARIILRNGAGRTAWSFRALFNQPEVTSMLRGGARGTTETPYWRQVLRYCAEGCLPAVLDEYVHVLRDHLGLMSGTVGDRVHEIADEISDALALRASQVGYDDFRMSDSGRTVRREARKLRTHFALRLTGEASDDGSPATRADQVRKAFNSPFWPFVLATTSVGQEGLDFHTYCHAVTHWNLPSNPVDLEQREGRVHRYKGHAVRKNVGRAHGWAALQSDDRDPWEAMFRAARQEAALEGKSEIVPFWVYLVPGGARIERHILSLPLSREHAQAARLRTSLAVYRMVFGQPRQEDLLRYLVERVPAAEIDRIMREARIDLSPGVRGLGAVEPREPAVDRWAQRA
jgi:Helicase conserved C-terminal domain